MKLKEVELIDTDSKNRDGEILEIRGDSILVGCGRGSYRDIETSTKI